MVGQWSTGSLASHLMSHPPPRWHEWRASPTYRRLKECLGRALQETGLRKQAYAAIAS